MSSNIERYQTALDDVEAQLLDCFAGFRDGKRSVDDVIDEIRGLGDDIKATGDPDQLAALNEVMHRPFKAWRASFDRSVDSGAA